MDQIAWMNFEGGLPLLLPANLLQHWSGFYTLVPDDEGADEFEDELYDLVLPDGRRFDIDDEFDFERPKTAYDRICAAEMCAERKPGPFLFPVGAGWAVALGDHGEGPLGWWASQQIIVAGHKRLPPARELDELLWRKEFSWRFDESTLILMNAVLHGQAPDLLTCGEAVAIELERGEYAIASAVVHGHPPVTLYRFTRVNS